jgi:hypothetical protein
MLHTRGHFNNITKLPQLSNVRGQYPIYLHALLLKESLLSKILKIKIFFLIYHTVDKQMRILNPVW